MLKFVEREQLLSLVNRYVQNKEAIVSNARKGC
jgi:hypothetical protein